MVYLDCPSLFKAISRIRRRITPCSLQAYSNRAARRAEVVALAFPRSPHCDETVQKKFACRITKTQRRFAVLAITGNRAANWRRRCGIRQFLPFRVTYVLRRDFRPFRSTSTLAVAKQSLTQLRILWMEEDSQHLEDGSHDLCFGNQIC